MHRKILVVLLMATLLVGCGSKQSFEVLQYSQPFLIEPMAITVDKDGNLYILDHYVNDGLIKKYDSKGNFLKQFGKLGLREEDFQTPVRLAIDGDNYLYITDPGGISGGKRQRRIQKYDVEGNYIKTMKSFSVRKGESAYYGPYGLVFQDKIAYLINVDAIIKLNQEGKVVAELGKQSPSIFGYYLSDYIYGPESLTLDKAGNIYVLDTYSGVIRVLNHKGKLTRTIELPRKVRITEPLKGQIQIFKDRLFFLDMEKSQMYVLSLTGKKEFYFGSSGKEKLNMPQDFCIDQRGMIYIADYGSHCVKIFDQQGNFLKKIGDLKKDAFFLNQPHDLVSGGKDILYVADTKNDRLVKVNFRTKSKKTVLDGLNQPTSLVRDSKGNFYVVDAHHTRRRKFDKQGNYLTEIKQSGDLAIDEEENLYLGNSSYVLKLDRQLQEVMRSENSQQLALYNQGHLVVNQKDGKIYLVDQIFSQIKCFSKAGKLLFVFGKQGSAQGELLQPGGIAMDSKGRIYIANTGNHRIEIFDLKGNFIKNRGQFGAGKEEFYSPEGVMVDQDDNLYVADTNNNRIIKLRIESRR